ncbi:Hypothetical predicted protein [Pelobates cultripes]|uniref:Uncharacterized protein n=1 Tax=Pelobates cultripes TaxID=61616 RepID=A0AAD1S7D2_PELCU|nr:Hypothetical predicted protein [Pelobates cultripes]
MNTHQTAPLNQQYLQPLSYLTGLRSLRVHPISLPHILLPRVTGILTSHSRPQATRPLFTCILRTTPKSISHNRHMECHICHGHLDMTHTRGTLNTTITVQPTQYPLQDPRLITS